jgi:integrase
MPDEKYDKKALEQQIPKKLREQLRADGLPPTELPTYEYLKTTKYHPRGLSKAIKRHYGDDTTLHDYLRDHGFGKEINESWPTTHAKTIELLNEFRDSRKDRRDDAENTVSTIESGMRKVLTISDDLHGTDDLLSYARYDTEKERQQNHYQLYAICDEMNETLSDGCIDNYMRYFREFYNFAATIADVTENPVKKIEGQYDFDTEPESEVIVPTDEELRAVWDTLKRLPEQDEFSDSVQNLIEKHGLELWRIMTMALLLLGVGTGPRSGECESMDCEEHWHLGEKPYIMFPERKNQSGSVPILSHHKFFEKYRHYLESLFEHWNKKPFPSGTSECGSRRATTLNNWLEALWIEADIRLSNGEYPTIQNLRQKWHNKYLEVQRKREDHFELVADERDKKDTEHIKSNYESTKEKREAIRQLVKFDLENIFPLSELPEELIDEPEGQTSIEDF